MQDEENEYVDKSQWLPLKEVKKYADFAVEHGRKLLNNGSILPSKQNKPAIDRLHEDERIPDKDGNPTKHPVLEGHHRDIGIRFKVLCDCAEGRFVSVTPPSLEVAGVIIPPALQRAAIYHQLTIRQAHYVNRVLFDRVSEADYGWMRNCAGTLQSAFEALFEAYKKENLEQAVRSVQKKEFDKNPAAAKMVENFHATIAPKIYSPL